jgi:hypothetical protein
VQHEPGLHRYPETNLAGQTKSTLITGVTPNGRSIAIVQILRGGDERLLDLHSSRTEEAATVARAGGPRGHQPSPGPI